MAAVEDHQHGRGHQIWGGASDKLWHAPASRILFVLEGGNNDVAIDGVEALLDPDRIIPRLEISSEKLGNVFLTTEDVVLPIDDLRRHAGVEDHRFLGRMFAAKARKRSRMAWPKSNRRSKRNGYFLVHLTSTKGGQVVADQFTSFAVIPPIDFASLKESPFGAMTHFAQGWETDILPLLVKAGITTDPRRGILGAAWKRRRGEFVFPERSDAYMAEAKRLGIDPIVAMTFGNPLYDGGHAPATPEGREAYARYGEELLRHYGSQIRWLEVWNEYNGSWCGGEAEKDRPKYYAEMIKAVYPKLKAVQPDVKVLGCAAVVIPMPYFEGIFKHGGLRGDGRGGDPSLPRPAGRRRSRGRRACSSLIRKYNGGRTSRSGSPRPAPGIASEYDWEKGKGLSLWDAPTSPATWCGSMPCSFPPARSRRSVGI